MIFWSLFFFSFFMLLVGGSKQTRGYRATKLGLRTYRHYKRKNW